MNDQASVEQRIMDNHVYPEAKGEAEEPSADSDSAEQPEEQTTTEDIPGDDSTDSEDAQPQAEDVSEIEFNGKKYQVPKELKEPLERQADYTRKTQELAAIRNAVELRQQAASESQSFESSVKEEMSQLQALDAQIGQYKQLDWNSLDVEQMVKLKHSLDSLKEQRQGLKESLDAKRGEFSQKMESFYGEAVQKTERFMAEKVPNWNNQAGKALCEYAVEIGFTPVSVRSIVTDPVATLSLWKAMQYDSLQAKKGSALQKAASAPPIVKPGSSNPEMQAKMKDLAFKKQMKSAKSPQEKARLIQQKLEAKMR